MLSLLKNSSLIRCLNAVAAGQTEQTGTGVDMSDAEVVTFYAAFGAITGGAVTSIKAQQSSDNGVADGWSDLEGSSVAVADTDDNKVVPLEIVRPLKRYVRLVISRGTQNAVIDGVIAVKTHLRVRPGVNDTTTALAGESHAGPAEGTA